MRINNLIQRKQSGYALMLVLIFTSISLLVLSGALSWSNTNAVHIQRYNQYQNTVAAADSATEKVTADMKTLFQSDGEGAVYSKLSTYQTWVPTSTENSYWSNFEFNDGASHVGQTTVVREAAPTSYTNLTGPYTGLYGLVGLYKLVTNARQLNSPYDITVGLKREVGLTTIPVFQFAIFYSMDLEVNPGSTMKVTGRVHSNADMYVNPGSSLEFQGDVTLVGKTYSYRKETPHKTESGTATYDKAHTEGFHSLSLPIGTNNSSDAVYAILQIPPSTEDRLSEIGKTRYYNKADIIVLVSNDNVTITSGLTNGFATSFSTDTNWISTNANYTGAILQTNLTFKDQREVKTIQTTTINVANLKRWSLTNSVIHHLFGDDLSRQVKSIYVADYRFTNDVTYGTGILVTNGQSLPTNGLTIATPQPLYVAGHYNCPNANLGTLNTSNTYPASFVCDAINILSTRWNPTNSTSSLAYRLADNTTINAAIISGIVPTVGADYSGGAENYLRLHEDWGKNSSVLTYSGSMVMMFNSQVATNKWPGTTSVYTVPSRNWAFDLNFLNPNGIPPGTPSVITFDRKMWTLIPKNTTL